MNLVTLNALKRNWVDCNNMKENFTKKIQSRGYWRINFQPTLDKSRLSFPECRGIVERNRVSFRGWDYPHYPRRSGDDTDIEPHDNFYQGWINWENHKEFWRMYQSGQFIHYLALREDWFDEAQMWKPDGAEIKPFTKLNIIGSVIYQITEIFEFLSRLSKEGIYDEGVKINISLINTEGRELWISDTMRGPFFQAYRAHLEKIEYSNLYSKEEIITSPQKLALNVIKFFFQRFGWEDPSDEVIMKDQFDLIKSKFY